MNKRIIAVILSLCTALGITVIADYKEEYPWAADAVEYCLENDILKGDENGDLMLSEHLTQAQCAALLVRTFDANYINLRVIEIPEKHWAKEEIELVSGYLMRPEDFEADENATREMFISTLVRSVGIGAEQKVSVLKDNFRDYSSIYPEYLPYMAAAFNYKLAMGSENKIFPKDFLTRAEAVTLIYRAKTSEDINAPEPARKTDLLGDALVDVESAIKWAESKGAHERFIEVATYYWKYGELTGIRPEVLYAQAGKETGFGKYGGRVLPEMNNWAGIKKYGATGDETEDHEFFETPEDGVRGHFNHMSAYVGVEPIGEPHGRYKSVRSLSWAGTVKYVEELGGKWCPDVEYGKMLVSLVDEMMKY